jgi:hypothetical protein
LDKISSIREKGEDHSLSSSSSTFMDFSSTMEVCGFFCTWCFGKIKEEVIVMTFFILHIKILHLAPCHNILYPQMFTKLHWLIYNSFNFFLKFLLLWASITFSHQECHNYGRSMVFWGYFRKCFTCVFVHKCEVFNKMIG